MIFRPGSISSRAAAGKNHELKQALARFVKPGVGGVEEVFLGHAVGEEDEVFDFRIVSAELAEGFWFRSATWRDRPSDFRFFRKVSSF